MDVVESLRGQTNTEFCFEVDKVLQVLFVCRHLWKELTLLKSKCECHRVCLCGGRCSPFVTAGFTATWKIVHSALLGSGRTAEYTEGQTNQSSNLQKVPFLIINLNLKWHFQYCLSRSGQEALLLYVHRQGMKQSERRDSASALNAFWDLNFYL